MLFQWRGILNEEENGKDDLNVSMGDVREVTQ